MRVGSIVYATEQGLGRLARSFYKAGVVTDVAIIAHGRHETHWGWYPSESLRIGDLRRGRKDLMEWCNRMDVMLFFETPFVWELIPYCRTIGVPTILIPMHECTPREFPLPDTLACPSAYDFDTFQAYHGIRSGVNSTVEVIIDQIPVDAPKWRKRGVIREFVHNAGHGGLRGRNGTRELLEALPKVDPCSLLIRSQEFVPFLNMDAGETKQIGNVTVEYSLGTIRWEDLWEQGDCFIFPEKFNGLSLPLQEAKASGMLVLTSDRSANDWLVNEPKIRVSGYQKSRIGPAYREYDEAVIKPWAIADAMNSVIGQDFSELSEEGRTFAEKMAWSNLKGSWDLIIRDTYRRVKQCTR